MKIKVCGMKHAENIQTVLALQPDFMGFIFYPKSKRFVGDSLELITQINFPATVQKVGVFVNETTEKILFYHEKMDFQLIQLHGEESPEQCAELKNKGLKIIKAISTAKGGDFSHAIAYEPVCDFFLFDTPTEAYGGSGIKFDWSVLDNYHGALPFFLSGGIGLDDLDAVKAFKHPKLFALDVNSKFEIEPALKNVEMLSSLFKLQSPITQNIPNAPNTQKT